MVSHETTRPSEDQPPNPYAVLAAAVLLPGSGHVWLSQAQRGLTFLFFMLALGWLTSMVASPGVSFVGQHAGGFMVYALSVMDAYRIARRRWDASRAEPRHMGRPSPPPGAGP